MNPPPPALNQPATIKASILGLTIDALSRQTALERCARFMSGARVAHVVTGNTLMAVEAEQNPALRQACLAADLTIPDSTGLVWAADALGQPPLDRFPGIDLAFDLCRRAAVHDVPVFLFGGAPGVAESASAHLRVTLPGLNVVGVRSGFFSASNEMDIIDAVIGSGARLVLVALGMPRQEVWIHAHKDRLPPGLYLGVGGTFDVWAGAVRRAPAWARALGIEWLFRLVREPWRAGRMVGLLVFVWRVLLSRTTNANP